MTDRREKAQTILKELQDSAALKNIGRPKLNCLYLRYLYVTLTGNAEAEGHFDPPAAAVCVGGARAAACFYYLMLRRLGEEPQKESGYGADQHGAGSLRIGCTRAHSSMRRRD
ncbi:MAG: hypothetical protein ACLR8P_07080 [Clostridium fessum]